MVCSTLAPNQDELRTHQIKSTNALGFRQLAIAAKIDGQSRKRFDLNKVCVATSTHHFTTWHIWYPFAAGIYFYT